MVTNPLRVNPRPEQSSTITRQLQLPKPFLPETWWDVLNVVKLKNTIELSQNRNSICFGTICETIVPI
jgi:hypothetical protein